MGRGSVPSITPASDEKAVIRYLRHALSEALINVPDADFAGIDGSVFLGLDQETIELCFPALLDREKQELHALVKSLRREFEGARGGSDRYSRSSLGSGSGSRSATNLHRSTTPKKRGGRDDYAGSTSASSGEWEAAARMGRYPSDRKLPRSQTPPANYGGRSVTPPRSGSHRSSRSMTPPPASRSGGSQRSSYRSETASLSLGSQSSKPSTDSRPGPGKLLHHRNAGPCTLHATAQDKAFAEKHFCNCCVEKHDIVERMEWLRRRACHGMPSNVCASCQKVLPWKIPETFQPPSRRPIVDEEGHHEHSRWKLRVGTKEDLKDGDWRLPVDHRFVGEPGSDITADSRRLQKKKIQGCGPQAISEHRPGSSMDRSVEKHKRKHRHISWTGPPLDLSVKESYERYELLRKLLIFGDDGRLQRGKSKRGFNLRNPGLPQLRRWLTEQDWRSFTYRPFLDWCLPVANPTATSESTYSVTPYCLQKLKNDDIYMNHYRQVVTVVCASWGFDIHPAPGSGAVVKELLCPDLGQRWHKEHSWRLRHALLSVELFGAHDMRERLIDMAAILAWSGRLNTEEDGFTEARNALGKEKAPPWWLQFCAHCDKRPPTLGELLKAGAGSDFGKQRGMGPEHEGPEHNHRHWPRDPHSRAARYWPEAKRGS